MNSVIYASSCAIDRIETGKSIRRFRQSRGLSVMDVSDLFGGMARNSIYKWERGDTLPSIDNLYSLAWVFGVTLDELVVGNRESFDRSDDDRLVELYVEKERTYALRIFALFVCCNLQGARHVCLPKSIILLLSEIRYNKLRKKDMVYRTLVE